MPTRFRRYDSEQPLLPPPNLREWLPDSHLALHIRYSGAARSVGVLCAVCRRWLAQHAHLPSNHSRLLSKHRIHACKRLHANSVPASIAEIPFRIKSRGGIFKIQR